MTRSPGLAQRLRDDTQPLHSRAERAGVMPALLRGALPARAFHQLQRNLLVIYAAPGDCRTWGVEAFTQCGVAKFGPSEDSFCRVCRLI